MDICTLNFSMKKLTNSAGKLGVDSLRFVGDLEI